MSSRWVRMPTRRCSRVVWDPVCDNVSDFFGSYRVLVDRRVPSHQRYWQLYGMTAVFRMCCGHVA